VPAFNAARHLGAAIGSILAQTHAALEVVVVDDGSTDGSAAVARAVADPRVRVLSRPHAGPAAARNLGVAVAEGDLLAFLDADDLWVPGKLEWQLAALAAGPSLDMVFGHAVEFLTLPGAAGDGAMRHGEAVPAPCLGTLLIRAAEFRRVGPLATGWRVGEFLDWYARAVDAGLSQAMVPRIVLLRRRHEDNLGVRARQARQDYARVAAAIIARRRHDGRLPRP
jgi:glycosyltransferase involved in cell wall biosynthesis